MGACDSVTILTVAALGQGQMVSQLVVQLNDFLKDNTASTLCVRVLVYDLGLTQQVLAFRLGMLLCMSVD